MPTSGLVDEKTIVRSLIAALFIALSGVGGWAANSLADSIERNTVAIRQNERSITRLDANYAEILRRLDRIESKIDRLEGE